MGRCFSSNSHESERHLRLPVLVRPVQTSTPENSGNGAPIFLDKHCIVSSLVHGWEEPVPSHALRPEVHKRRGHWDSQRRWALGDCHVLGHGLRSEHVALCTPCEQVLKIIVIALQNGGGEVGGCRPAPTICKAYENMG